MIPANSIITLEYEGQEKILGDWDLTESGNTLDFPNLAAHTFVCRATLDDLTADPIIPYGGKIILWARELKTDGTINVETGQRIFHGERIQLVNTAAPEVSARDYTFANGWYDLEQRPFMQKKLVAAAYVGNAIVRTFDFTSEVVLGLKNDLTGLGTVGSSILNIGQQLRAILEYAIDPKGDGSVPGANFTIGTIDDAFNQDLHTYPVRDIKCAEALQTYLRSSPNAVIDWDYNGAVPVINILLSRTPVSQPYADGDKHKTSQIIPRYDLQLDCVLLIFKISGDVNGDTYVNYARNKYPNTANLEFSRGTLVQTIDLLGPSGTSTSLSAPLTVAANDFAAGGLGAGAADSGADPAVPNANDVTRRSWWAKRHVKFKDAARLQNVKFKNATGTLLDDAGAAVSLATYPNHVVEGSPADWMKLGSGASVLFKSAQLSVDYSGKEFRRDGITQKNQSNSETLGEKLTLTNAPVGTTIYTTRSSNLTSLGEPIPGATYIGLLPARDANGDVIYGRNSLAKYIYDQMAALQHEGTHTIKESSWTNSITPANSLNLSGDKLTGDLAALTAMAAPVQRVTIKFNSGSVETVVTFGPAKHLGAGDLTQLFLINRFRVAGNLDAVLGGKL